MTRRNTSNIKAVNRFDLGAWLEPYFRYQHNKSIHAIRLGLAIIVTLAISHWLQLRHSEWATITIFIILGVLQYEGAIYTKSIERLIGTIVGMLIGIGLMWSSQYLLGWNRAIFYLLVGIVSGTISYYAIKNLGYIGLLAGITMCMFISDDFHSFDDGISRAVNVLVGTVIALVASRIMPLKSTLMWRFLLGNNLLACSQIYATLCQNADQPVKIPLEDRQPLQKTLQEINRRLLASRPHLKATAQESKIDIEILESIQHTHRNLIGTIDLLLAAAPKISNVPLNEENNQILQACQTQIVKRLQHTALMLTSPKLREVETDKPAMSIDQADFAAMSFEWQGYFWLTQTLASQLQELVVLLTQTKSRWYRGSGRGYQRREHRRLIKTSNREEDIHIEM